MALLLTIDASIFVTACRAEEPGFSSARHLLAALRKSGTPLIEPALLPVETAAALRRAGLPAQDALEYALSIASLPRLTVVPLDIPLMQRSAQLAVENALRGADAIYVAVSELFGATLVTLDQEQLRRSPATVEACTPEAARRLLLKGT